ncbi:camphor resistance protein CrcB [Nostocoides sp. F2B08]|uniref:fluoride efflux transporter FluC n=1 Tax=Nostocoides sp. F2B08 TaxID=2653936 RepID=UPI0012633D40|nr:CrcB family protein [Tetrasphaera sp. F2B08]KAB7744002.1 camphor resistance protein CrcB [Tetrasphaera sp. F2B08]
MTLMLVALAGGLGACARYLLDGAITRRSALSVPVATLAVNVLGSFLLGFLVQWSALAAWGTDGQRALLAAVGGVGFLGGFTTFSTASVELVALVRSRRPVTAIVLAVSMLVLSLAFAMLGMLLARVLTG